jgi:hypothetical protein
MKYIIYGINVGDSTYIGSTKDLKQRKVRHKSNSINKNGKHYNLKLYQSIREAGGWDKCEVTPIEEYECEGQLQAHIREEYWRRLYNPDLNTIKAYTTEEEAKERDKELYLKQHICECGIVYTGFKKLRHERTKRHIKYLEEIRNLTIL